MTDSEKREEGLFEENETGGTGRTDAGVPIVSVIMPAYNCTRTIASSVESVLNQTYTDLELLIINDCSTDDTGELIRGLKKLDPKRVRTFTNTVNQGVGKTRMRGVKAARGKWIAFLDSDDMWRPDKLEKQLALTEREPEAKLVFTGSAFIDAAGQPLDYILEVPETITGKELRKQNLVSCSSVLIDKELMAAHPMPNPMNMHEDFASWLLILKEIPCAYGINEPLLIYRLAKSSKSGKKTKAALMNWNTYRYTGLSVPASLYYMGWYTVKGLLKYRHLKT